VSGYLPNNNSTKTSTMTDPHLRFAVYWVGSNKLLATNLEIRLDSKYVLESSAELQRKVAALAGVEQQQYIKITLGSPAGPQLTPLLRSLDTLFQGCFKACTWQQHMLLKQAATIAWSKLHIGKVNTFFVTQHTHSAVAVDQLVLGFGKRDASRMYKDLPQSTQCNPAVFITAHILCSGKLSIPDELRSNKKFALDCFKYRKRYNKYLPNLNLTHFDALQDDEDVVLASVVKHSTNLYSASPRLRASKAFVLKIVGVNGLCIEWAATELKQDKDVALAAVRQNSQALKFLCCELQEDRNIVAACANNNDTGTLKT
jgi:hypothetical protein